MRVGIVRAELGVPAAEVPLVEASADDVRAAGRVTDLTLVADETATDAVVVRAAELERQPA